MTKQEREALATHERQEYVVGAIVARFNGYPDGWYCERELLILEGVDTRLILRALRHAGFITSKTDEAGEILYRRAVK